MSNKMNAEERAVLAEAQKLFAEAKEREREAYSLREKRLKGEEILREEERQKGLVQRFKNDINVMCVNLGTEMRKRGIRFKTSALTREGKEKLFTVMRDGLMADIYVNGVGFSWQVYD